MGLSAPNGCPEPVVRSGYGSGAHADGRNKSEAGGMALVFGFSAPEAVFVLFASKNHAVSAYTATRTNVFRGCFATLSCLRPFGRRREEQMRQALAGPITHPVIYCVHLFIEIDDGHSSAP